MHVSPHGGLPVIVLAVALSSLVGCNRHLVIVPTVVTPERESKPLQSVRIAPTLQGGELSFDGVRFDLASSGVRGVRFRNLSHPDINAEWARKKTDEEGGVYDKLRSLGINWLPIGKVNAEGGLDKQTLCGSLVSYMFYGPEKSSERDWNLIIDPFNDYRYLIEEPRGGEWVGKVRTAGVRLLPIASLGFHKALDERMWHPSETKKQWKQGCAGKPMKRCFIETEVTPPPALRKSTHTFPAGQDVPHGKWLREVPLRLAEGSSICTYGVWVQEALHGFRPEIHPAEAFWWQASDTKAMHLLALQDASGRFDARDPSGWITPFGDAPDCDAVASNEPPTLPMLRGKYSRCRGEYWVQPRMKGEFLVLLRGPRSEQRAWSLALDGGSGVVSDSHRSELTVRGEDSPGELRIRIDAPVEAAIVSAATTPTEIVAILSLRMELEGEKDGTLHANRGSFAELVLSSEPAPEAR